MVTLTFLSSPHSGRPIRCALQVLADLAVFASLQGFPFFALLFIQLLPDMVHTGLFLMVMLSFLSSPHCGRPIWYALQVLANLAIFTSLEGFPFLSSPLHPAIPLHTVAF
jgi:hypothetical protein